MRPLAQVKARHADIVRSETLTFRLDAKLKFLSELAARSQGRKLSNFVESALREALGSVIVEDEREATHGNEPDYSPVRGRTLADIADTLYSTDDAVRFYNVATMVPWLATEGEAKLLAILIHSDYFAPARVLHASRVREDWEMLAAIRDGEAEMDILPAAHQPKGALLFGLKSSTERVALYKSDHVKFKRESEAYNKAMKGTK